MTLKPQLLDSIRMPPAPPNARRRFAPRFEAGRCDAPFTGLRRANRCPAAAATTLDAQRQSRGLRYPGVGRARSLVPRRRAGVSISEDERRRTGQRRVDRRKSPRFAANNRHCDRPPASYITTLRVVRACVRLPRFEALRASHRRTDGVAGYGAGQRSPAVKQRNG
jgi:hypothetical protein